MSKGNDFLRVLGEQRGGLVALNIAQKQEEVIEAIQAAGKKGSLTITINYEPVGSGGKEVHVTTKVAIKKPADPNIEERSIFYAKHGQLHRDDPDARPHYGGPQRDTGRADGSSPAEQRTGTHD